MKKSIIIKFDYSNEQTVGEITKIVGLVEAKFIIPIIDGLNLEANPRSAKTGSVTDAIQDSIENDSKVFPFKTKGILLASSQYEKLDRGRLKITPDNPEIEGILDGGHNTLAIGLYILAKATNSAGISLPKGAKTWSEFKKMWVDHREIINDYLEIIKSDSTIKDLHFYVPVELLVPRDTEDFECVEAFKNDLLEICAARNNNVELQLSAKSNQKGYFDTLRAYMSESNSYISDRIEWKLNEGGDIKVQDLIALVWIPLSLVDTVSDIDGKNIEPVIANKIYSGKGACLKQFEKLMSSPDVTFETSSDYRRELKNSEVSSALKVAADIPELYDYIYESFPTLYNADGGKYGRITAVKSLNAKRREKRAPFTAKKVETLSPDGFIVPLVYGLQSLMEKQVIDGRSVIRWIVPPMEFLQENLKKIVEDYVGILSLCDYDPQKVGKSNQSYITALKGYKMALAGLL